MASIGDSNVAAKVLGGILVALVASIMSFIAGRVTGPADFDPRLRQTEQAIVMIQTDLDWIRAALENRGYTP
jgi:hypothetical protein